MPFLLHITAFRKKIRNSNGLIFELKFGQGSYYFFRFRLGLSNERTFDILLRAGPSEIGADMMEWKQKRVIILDANPYSTRFDTLQIYRKICFLGTEVTLRKCQHESRLVVSIPKTILKSFYYSIDIWYNTRWQNV